MEDALRGQVANDANLSDIGKKAAFRVRLEDAAKASAQARVDLRNARKALKAPTLPAYAPETAMLSFMEHQEQRTFLWSLPPEQREKLAPRFADAIVRAPAAMSQAPVVGCDALCDWLVGRTSRD